MSPPSASDPRIYELDRIINSLRNLEGSLRRFVKRVESISMKMPVIFEEDEPQEEWFEGRQRLKKRVILISEKKMILITKEDRVLYSCLNRLVEYKINILEKMSLLEKKKRMGK